MADLKPYSHRYAYVYCNDVFERREFLGWNNRQERLQKLTILYNKVQKVAKLHPDNRYYIELKDL